MRIHGPKQLSKKIKGNRLRHKPEPVVTKKKKRHQQRASKEEEQNKSERSSKPTKLSAKKKRDKFFYFNLFVRDISIKLNISCIKL